MRNSYDLRDWKYLTLHKVYRKGVTISEDGAWFVIKSSKKPIAKYITTFSHGNPARLFWWKRVHQLEHIHRLLRRLIARRNAFWNNVARPFMDSIMGEDNEQVFYYLREGKPQGIRLYRNKKTEYDKVRFGADFDNIEKEYYSWSSFYDRDSDGLSVPEWMKPVVPTKAGARLQWLLGYDGDLMDRVRKIRTILFFCINQRLRTLSKNHKVGDVIRFKLNEETFTYQYSNNMEWKQIGSDVIDIDLLSISPEIPRYF